MDALTFKLLEATRAQDPVRIVGTHGWLMHFSCAIQEALPELPTLERVLYHERFELLPEDLREPMFMRGTLCLRCARILWTC